MQEYALNVQLVGNDVFIYDLDVGWPGGTHDARIWNRSKNKRHIEIQKRFLLAGDSGLLQHLSSPHRDSQTGCGQEEEAKVVDPVKYHEAWKALSEVDGALVPVGFG